MSDAQAIEKQNPGLDTKHDSAGAKHPATGGSGNPQTGEPFEIAKPDAHQRLDGKDERSHPNALEDAKRVEKLEKEAEKEHEDALRHPTQAAKAHGNKPSAGAVKDEKILDDEEEELRKKDEAKKQSAEAHKPKHH
ncbi:uncharacterized protein I303_107487 [Kwoniella dejecticola CBS 10117]|uniref:Uncharacterized protein n=1 Tax=Kwoniella dejecticola CBS 10117 TaxID=1296121 RepID=A0A1A5ZZU5_9TREE|nr:uncharacterized protein I303_06892 [Kwoniella dejecticola CBS 10117]OBR83327.1 hypothetical protein I303_06892 [Kwoniella dejecticola CBS 10117]